MDVREQLIQAINNSVKSAQAAGLLPQGEMPSFVLEVPPKKELGDFATNAAMQSARVFHRKPRDIAEAIVSSLSADFIDHTVIAGPGFINFYLKGNVLYDNLASIIAKGDAFGQLPPKDVKKIQVEYVSANPTGLLHVGHGRGAACGSALVNLLRAAGYPVESEYYINDAGNQIDHLAESVNARYLQLFGIDAQVPDDGYRGDDIIDTARVIKDRDGDKYLHMDESERLAILKEISLKEKLECLKRDLQAFNVNFDVWFSERTLHPEAINDAVEALKKTGDIYEKDGALWLKSTAYGDDKDRVVIRDNGVPTYLAADIAYHLNKFQRGFGKVINIWGADHHGYIARVKAALSMFGYDPDNLKVLLLQMVNLYRDGELVKMSKRTGESVTLEELIEEVGTDAARYFFIMRSLDSQLDFDINLAKSQSNDNPVYYVQYAYARIASIFRQAAEMGINTNEAPDLTLLTEEKEIDLIKKIAEYPDEIERAATDYAPQRIARYVYDLAGAFHSFYNQCRCMGIEPELAKARLALCGAAQRIIRLALGILGISAPEKM